MNAYVVDRKALEQNIQVLREKAGDTPIYGVIKGNGYGLGLIPMAQVLREGGIDRFAVTSLNEVCALREGGFTEEEILMMRATCIPEELEVLLEQSATATVEFSGVCHHHGSGGGENGQALPVPPENRHRNGPIRLPAGSAGGDAEGIQSSSFTGDGHLHPFPQPRFPARRIPGHSSRPLPAFWTSWVRRAMTLEPGTAAIPRHSSSIRRCIWMGCGWAQRCWVG